MRTQAQSHLNACEEGDKGVMHLISSRRENSITNCLVARGSVCVCVSVTMRERIKAREKAVHSQIFLGGSFSFTLVCRPISSPELS